MQNQNESHKEKEKTFTIERASMIHEPSRRIFTSMNSEIPVQMTYQNIKLANFLELELTDLWDSLLHINSHDNFTNKIKDTISRSYNAFYEMKKLFDDLGMNFLYLQVKKLVSGYGVIFVHLIEKIEKLEKQRKKQATQPIKPVSDKPNSNIQEEIRSNIQNLKERRCSLQTRNLKRIRGIHLYNESYARNIDYDINLIRKIRQQEQEKQISDEEKKMLEKEESRKFRREIIEEVTSDPTNVTIDGEDIYDSYFKRYEAVNFIENKICLSEELEKITEFFKQAHHQAILFMRKQKSSQNFHELTEGFNSVVLDYETLKNTQINFAQDKVKEIFDYFKSQIDALKLQIQRKDRQITKLNNICNFRKYSNIKNAFAQTNENYEDLMKALHFKVVTSERVNDQLKSQYTKYMEEQRKEKAGLLQQIQLNSINLKEMKDTLDQKIQYLVKIERKLRIIELGNRTQGLKTPIQTFNSFSLQMKKEFIEQLKEQGLLKPTKKNSIMVSRKNMEKRDSFTAEENSEMDNNSFVNSIASRFTRPSKSLQKKNYSSILKDINLMGMKDQKDTSESNSINLNIYSNAAHRAHQTQQKTIRKNQSYKIENAENEKHRIIPRQTDTSEMPTNMKLNKTQQMQNNDVHEEIKEKHVEIQDNHKLLRNLHNDPDYPEKSHKKIQIKKVMGNRGDFVNRKTILLNKTNEAEKKTNEDNNYNIRNTQVEEAQRAPRENCMASLHSFDRDYDKEKNEWDMKSSRKGLNRNAQNYNINQIEKPNPVDDETRMQLLKVSEEESPGMTANSWLRDGKRDIQYQLENMLDVKIKKNKELLVKKYRIVNQVSLIINRKGQASMPCLKQYFINRGQNSSSQKLELLTEDYRKAVTLHKGEKQQLPFYMDKSKLKSKLQNNETAIKQLSNTFYESKSPLNEQRARNTVNILKTNRKNTEMQPGLISSIPEIQLLEQELESVQLVQASRTCNTISEFKEKVIKTHVLKCGKQCKHMQRYLDIFEKIKKESSRNRKQIKMHIENLNCGKFGDDAALNLPNIGKK